VLHWAHRSVVLLLPACFHPSYDHPACGQHGECPGGLSCSAALVCENGSSASSPDGGSALSDGAIVDLSPICASIALGTPLFRASACATPTRASIHVTASTSIDTDQGTSDPSGLTCDRVANGNDHLCVLVAPSIVIDPGVVLSAHGSIPLAVFAHALTIHGTVDVASHIGMPVGAGALTDGCTKGTLPKLSGGGHGGTDAAAGGNGGNGGSQSGTGGTVAPSFGIDIVIGGCGGTLGGDGSAGGGDDAGRTTGGPGGGAVWLVSDTGPLVIDAGAAINASGASGAGGITEGHGGAGGGAGGLIVLQSPSIQLSSSAVIFANGGHGGGGAGTMTGFTGGGNGTDPTGPQSGGGGGTGGADGSGVITSGDGGPGYPISPLTGQDGGTDHHGGGGGGGGPGAIRVANATDLTGLTGSNVSPMPLLLQ
jgi:hypothetical protein